MRKKFLSWLNDLVKLEFICNGTVTMSRYLKLWTNFRSDMDPSQKTCRLNSRLMKVQKLSKVLNVAFLLSSNMTKGN